MIWRDCLLQQVFETEDNRIAESELVEYQAVYDDGWYQAATTITEA